MVFQLTKRLAFPDPHWGDPDGLLAIGGDLSVDLVCLPRESHPVVVSVTALRHLSGRDSHLPLHAHTDEQG